ncbi:MAG: endonuclease/exonuclease/phosphatase family protein [Fibrobacteria bacterium]|nr:endonuclease/exonuclease/phosphatase family protein [Fibrobacteria bacterium]
MAIDRFLRGILLLLLGIVAHGFAWTGVKRATLVESKEPSEVSPLPGRWSLVVWNVHKRTDSTFRNELNQLMDSCHPSLVLLQEAVPDSAWILRALDAVPWSFAANLLDPARHRWSGVLTAGASLARSVAVLTSDLEPIVGTPKPILATWHPRGNGGGRPDTLLVVNLHALNFKIGLDAFRRQMLQVAGILDHHQGPALVAGDFNTWSAKRLALADSVLGAAGQSRLEFGKLSPLRRTALGRPLDQIYYSRVFLEVDTTGLDVPVRFKSSDHVPLVATFGRGASGDERAGSKNTVQRESQEKTRFNSDRP